MNSLDIELKFKRLEKYNQSDFEKKLIERLNTEPKQDDFNFEILFNDKNCLIKLSSNKFNKETLLKLFTGSIVPLDDIYDNISDLEITYS